MSYTGKIINSSSIIKASLNGGGAIIYQTEEAAIDSMFINTNGELIVKLATGTQINLGQVTDIDKLVVNAMGSIIVLSDSSEHPFDGFKVYGKSTQNGIPSPIAPAAISGVEKIMVSNENLLCFPYQNSNGYTNNGITYKINTDGSITANGTATGESFFYFATINKKGLYLPAGTYHFSGVPEGTYGGTRRPQYWVTTPSKSINTGVYAEGKTFTLTQGEYISIGIDIVEGNVLENAVFKPMINIGEHAIPYTPPSFQTLTLPVTNGLHGIPVQSGGNYTDTSGQQWICDEIDLERGVYIQRVKRVVYAGANDFKREYSERSETYQFFRTVSDAKKSSACLCNYVPSKIGNQYNACWVDSGQYFLIRFPEDLQETTVEEFATMRAETPLELVYILAEPIEKKLTLNDLADYSALTANHLNTTIINDGSADMYVAYCQDLKSYIDKRTSGIESVASDISALQNELNDVRNSSISTSEFDEIHKQHSMLARASGEVITISDSSEAPLQNLIVYGKTTQDGVPSPNSPVELKTAGTDGSVQVSVKNGNLLSQPYRNSNGYTNNGITYTVNDDGSVTANGTATGESMFYLSNVANQNLYLAQGRYRFSGVPEGDFGGVSDIQFYVSTPDGKTKAGIFAGGRTVEIFDGTYVGFAIDITEGNVLDNVTFYPMVNVGEIALPYDPPKTQTLTIQTPGGLPGVPVDVDGNYTDKYGQQWVCDEIDFKRGVYIKRVSRVIFDDKAEFIREYKDSPGVYQFYKLISDAKPLSKCICNYAPCLKNGKYNACRIVSDSYFTIRFPEDLQETTVEEFAAMRAETPLELVYILSEPVETVLSSDVLAKYATLHTNRPNSTVINNTGAKMDVGYFVDVWSFIEAQKQDTFVKPVNSAWEQKMLKRIDLAMIPIVALRDIPKAPSGYTRKGNTLTGINYSATQLTNKGAGLIGTHVPIKVYYSCMENPASKMYTLDDWQESGGRSTYYGINCSGFTSYCFGWDYTTTREMAALFGSKALDITTEDDLYQVRRGDIILNTVIAHGDKDHVKFVKDTVYDAKTGQLIGFNVAESWKPFVRVVFMDFPTFLAQMFEDEQPYRVLRLDDSDYGTKKFEPLTYSKSVYPDNGDGGAYTLGEKVQLYIPDYTASTITYTAEGGTATSVSLNSLSTSVVNGVIVYSLILDTAGTYSICTDTATDDPCTVIMVDSLAAG